MRFDISGVICPNSDKWLYDWFEIDATCPRDVQRAIDQCPMGETLDVYINSGGGEISAGSAIYTALRSFGNRVKVHVTGLAASAASVIMCAGYCDISPTAMVMIHCVSTRASGNHTDLEAVAVTLSKADKAMCQAYVLKTGRPEEELLALMEKEHWMTAQEAVDGGFCDALMEGAPMLAASCGATLFDSGDIALLGQLLEQEKRYQNLGGTT